MLGFKQASPAEMAAIEKYILSERAQIIESLKMLVENSPPYNYLQFSHALVTQLKLSNEQKMEFEKFIKETDNPPRDLMLKKLLMEYDASGSEKEKSEIIEKLAKDFLKLTWEDHRPQDIPAGNREEQDDVLAPITDSINYMDEMKKILAKEIASKEKTDKSAPREKPESGTYQKVFNSFTSFALTQLDFSKIESSSDFFNWLNIIKNDIPNIDSPLLIKTWAKFLKERYNESKNYSLETDLMARITLKQLEALYNELPEAMNDIHAVKILIKKKFYVELDWKRERTKEETLKDLIKVYNFVNAAKLKEDYEMGLKAMLLLEILNIDLYLDVIEEKYFKEYLKCPLTYNIVVKPKVAIGSDFEEFFPNLGTEQQRKGVERKVITENLEKLITLGISMEGYKEFFDPIFLANIAESTAVMTGKPVVATADNAIRLNSLNQMTLIEISNQKYNKDTFNFGDTISLYVVLKNIPSLSIKIFEINAEKYYLHFRKKIDTSISLDGFSASFEQSIVYDHSPAIKHRENLSLPFLQKKYGVFVVELIGNGKLARAVIKIGKLGHISKICKKSNTHVMKIVDQTGSICIGPHTGIWTTPTTFLEADKSGKIVIPSSNTNSPSENCVITHNNMAELITLIQYPNAIAMKCSFYLNPESALMGNKATIFIKPVFYREDFMVSLPASAISNIEVNINQDSYIDDIPIRKSIPITNANFSQNSHIEVSFTVCPNIMELSVVLNCDVKLDNEEKQHLSDEKCFNIVTHHEDNGILCEMYMRFSTEGSGYEIGVLGKNGEPITGTVVSLSIYSSYLKYTIQQCKKTDGNGVIKLGKLQNAEFVEAKIAVGGSKNIIRSWQLPPKCFYTYPEVIDIMENETIDLPFACDSLGHTYLCKISKNNGGEMIEILKDKVTIKNEGDSNILCLSPLPAGSYILRKISQHFMNIKIEVHKGIPWSVNPTNYIQTPVSIIKRSYKKSHYCPINGITISESETHKNIQISCPNYLESVSASKSELRGHIILANFIPSNIQESSQAFLDYAITGNTSIPSLSSCEFPIQKQVLTLSNRELSSEVRYCLDRRKLPPMTGSTLEKPTLLLKQNFIGMTESEQEVLIAGNEKEIEDIGIRTKECEEKGGGGKKNYYKKNRNVEYSEEESDDDRKMSKKMRSKKKRRSKKVKAHNTNEIFDEDNGSDEVDNLLVPPTSNEIIEFANFLGVPAKCFFNLKAESSSGRNMIMKAAIEKSDFKKYHYLYAIVVGKTAVTHKIIVINYDSFPQVPKRNLTLENPFASSKTYIETQLWLPLPANTVHVIDDYTSTKFTIIDSLSLQYALMRDLIKGRKYVDSQDEEQLIKAFAFLPNWMELSQEEKLRIYTKYSSHELNLFLYKKDKVFFNSVVKSYLCNKMEKEFYDKYVLEMPLDEYPASSVNFFDEFSDLQRALYIERLAQTSLEKAKFLAERMRQETEDPEEKKEDYQRTFEIILMREKISKDNEENKEEDNQADRKLDMAGVSPEMIEMAEGEAAGECECERAYGGGGYDEEEDDGFREKRNIKHPYEEKGETKEYEETQHYTEKGLIRIIGRASPLRFWADYADYICKTAKLKEKPPFLSANCVWNPDTLLDAIGSLALIDLPFTAEEHNMKYSGRTLEITTKSNAIIFKKTIKEGSGYSADNNILLAQIVSPEQNPEEILSSKEELVIGKPYRGQAIITNISSQSLDCTVLVQIPQGSLPIYKSSYQKNYPLKVSSFASEKVEYYFYFPSPGKFSHASPMVSVNQKVVSKLASPGIYNILSRKTKISEKNFKDILSYGTTDQIITFLRDNPSESIPNFYYNQLYFLCKDVHFWKLLIKLLRAQGKFEEHIWSYSLYHKSEHEIKEYLESWPSCLNLPNITSSFITYSSKLGNIKPNKQRYYNYFPIINVRAHTIITSKSGGSELKILNRNLRKTYYEFLFLMLYKNPWEPMDRLKLAEYLILQERIPEAYAVFKKITFPKNYVKGGVVQIQYDYLQSYFDFYYGEKTNYALARSLATKYLNYPILWWRLRFLDIHQQLQELDGVQITEEEEPEELKSGGDSIPLSMKKGKDIITEPVFNAKVDATNKTILLDYNNKVKMCEVKYYVTDAEVLFSRSPFVSQQSTEFSFVKPICSEKVLLDSSTTSHSVSLPASCLNKSLIIEVKADFGKQLILPFYSCSLNLRVYENYGELQVFDKISNKALSEIYIKVYARYKDSQHSVKFYKDGYTDIRGRFDYASLNTNLLKNAEKFAIFAMSDKLGSLIIECAGPVVGSENAVITGEKEVAKGRLKNYEEYQKKESSVPKMKKKI